MAKSMAAGYYEYSPRLFDPPKLTWSGPDPEHLKRDHQVWPDFHHAPDLDASGRVVDFLPAEAADAFALSTEASLSAVAYRPARRQESNQIDLWPVALTVGGEPVPELIAFTLP